MGSRDLLILEGVIGCMVAFILTEVTIIRFLLLFFIIIGGMAFFKFDIIYPFTWLAPAFFLYNASIYILELVGFRYLSHYSVILTSLFISICTLFFYCVLFVKRVKEKRLENDFLDTRRIRIIKTFLFLLGGYLLFCIPLFLRSGYSSKLEMNLHGGIFGFGIVSRWFILLYTMYLIYKVKNDHKFPLKTLFFSVILTLLLSLFIGERDVLLSVTLNSFLIYYYFYKPSILKVLLFLIVGLFAVSVLGEFRQITNKGDAPVGEKTLVESVLGSEFASSGNNFEILLDNRNSWNFQNGVGLVQDISYSFIPSFIIRVTTPSQWYNQLFNSRVDDGYGAGFSYLAEGYLQFGYFGVFVWTLLLVLIVHFLYIKSNITIFGFAAYLFMLSLIVYAMRGDLAYVISPLFKQVFISYLLLQYFFSIIGSKCK